MADAKFSWFWRSTTLTSCQPAVMHDELAILLRIPFSIYMRSILTQPLPGRCARYDNPHDLLWAVLALSLARLRPKLREGIVNSLTELIHKTSQSQSGSILTVLVKDKAWPSAAPPELTWFGFRLTHRGSFQMRATSTNICRGCSSIKPYLVLFLSSVLAWTTYLICCLLLVA